jgi:hypothetical protein
MISHNSFSLQHIQNIREKSKRDPALIERSIFAFGLLEAIQRSGLPFIFKGGTSLMLLMDEPQRFSTDIDLLVAPGVELDAYLATAAAIWPFVKKTEQIRKAKSNMEIIKQLFDISALMSHIGDFIEVKETYYKLARMEISYRNLSCGVAETLSDSMRTAATVAGRGAIYKDDYAMLKKGIYNVRNHIFSEEFNGETAVLRACMVMLLAAAVSSDQTALPVFKGDDYYMAATIPVCEYQKISHIRKTNSEAFKYFVEAVLLLHKPE